MEEKIRVTLRGERIEAVPGVRLEEGQLMASVEGAQALGEGVGMGARSKKTSTGTGPTMTQHQRWLKGTRVSFGGFDQGRAGSA